MDLILTFDRDLRVMGANKHGAAMLGMAEEEIPGARVTELPLWRDQDIDRLESMLFRSLRGEAPLPECFPVKLQEADAELMVTVCCEPRGLESAAGILAARDVSSERYAAAALRREKELSSMILETARALILVLDREGRIVRFNRMCEFTTGFTEREVMGKNVWDVILPEEWKLTVKRVFKDIVDEGGRFGNRFENPVVTKSGEKRWVAWNNAVLKDESGGVMYVIATGIDMTDYRRLEAEMAEHRKREALSGLAAGMAHDFNNILTAVMGNAEFLLMQQERDSSNRRELEDIVKSVKKGSELVKSLIEFSRNRAAEVEPVDVNGVVDENLELIGNTLGRRVSLETELCDEPCFVEADPLQLGMIVVNMAKNAKEAMPDGGTFTIRTEPAFSDRFPMGANQEGRYKPCVRITVSDSGKGMAEEVRRKVFEPYFTTKPRHQGSGLGLATAHALVHQWGGYIGCESRPGAGTRFTIELERIRRLHKGGPDKKELPRGDERVLLADGDDSVRGVLKRMLERLGYTVTEAKTEEEGLEAVEGGFEPDLAILDVNLPPAGGPQLAAKVRERKPHCRIIYLSEAEYPEDLRGAALDMIEKPASMETIANKVRRALDS